MPGLDRGSGGAAPHAAGQPAAGSERQLKTAGLWSRAGWLVALALTAAAVFGISRLRIDDELRSLVRDSSVDFRLMDEVAGLFGAPDRDCIVLADARGGDMFAARPLAELRELVTRLETVAGVEEVRSIFDVRRQGAAGALLPVIPRTAEPLDDAARAAAKARAVDHPLVAGHLLSRDGGAALVLVRLVPEADRPPLLPRVVADVEAAVAAFRAGGTALDLQVTGLPALREQAARALRRDMLVFNSLGLSLAVILSAAVARSLRSTVVACVPPFIGAVWSLALVVGTCDSIHFIEDMRRSVRRGLPPLAASQGAVHRVGAACGLTSLVTAVGFASLAAAKIDAVRGFGIAAAVGAVASFMAVTLLTPLIASTRFCSGLRLGRSSRAAGRLANRLAAFSVRHARPIVAVGCLATALLAWAGSGLDADTKVVDSLPRGAAAARALARVDAEFGGALGVDVLVRWPETVDWRDDAVTTALAGVHDVLADSGGIDRAISLATVADSLPPRGRRRLDPDQVRDLVAPEARAALVRARVSDLGSRALDAVYDRVELGLAGLAQTRPGWKFELAGMSVVSARNIRQLVRDLGSSLLLEVAVIGFILALAFRSPLAGIVSLIPNVFPLAVIGSLLALTGRSLDPATVIVFNVCLGLAVDDTVHVLSALARHRRAGLSIATSVRRAVVETGNPVVIGGLVLAVGFAAVTASSVPSLASFGLLACAAVAAATVAELILLPALLVVTEDLVRRHRPVRKDGIFGPAEPRWTAIGAPSRP
jgi:predicted RND superfamily exporter protein